jgi:DNA modification methylase
VIAESLLSGSVTVLDPFAGAATTLIAAKKLGVASRGVEAQSAVKYEIEVRYNNGDVIRGIFQTNEDAIHFLRRPTA